jgi:hypothetical protein
MRAAPTSTMLRACAAIILGLILAAGSGLPGSPAKADPSASVDFFYDSLEPDGRWVDHWKYGRVWYPRDMDEGWRPYTRGRWVLTDDYGWYWESSERFGWATYHYGRWDFDDDYGWIWVPGDQWGPAWVDWREGGGNIGWAPLPPGVVWRERGFDYAGIDIGSQRYRSSWCFVPEARFVSGDVHRHVLPQARNVTIINNTTKITNYTTVNNTIVNNSVSVARLNKVARMNIAPVKVVQAAAPVAGAPRTLLPGLDRRTAQVSVFRPEVKAGARALKPTNAIPAAIAGPAGKSAVPPATQPPPGIAPAAGEVPVLPKGGFAKSAPVAPPAGVMKSSPVQARPVGPDPRAQQAAAAEQARLRDLQARQAREASRQNREQVIERYTTVSKPREEIARKQAAERQELQRIQQNQRTVVQNRAAIPQPPKPQPVPQAKAAAQQAPHKAPPAAQKPGQQPPPDPRQPR